MKKRILRLRDRYVSDSAFKAFVSSLRSTLMGIGFALFNASLGVIYSSVWNGSISVYYMLLATVRGILAFSQRRYGAYPPVIGRRVFITTHILLLLTDLSLIAPIAYTVIGERSYRYGLIPAITMAAYTTYRVTVGVMHYCSKRKSDSLLERETGVINLQDALVAVLSLQNALIIANGTSMESMIPLTGWTSGAIWLLIVTFTARSFWDGVAKK